MTPSLLYACVAENRPRFATMVESLAISLRAFGGQSADDRFVALFVDAVDDGYAERLRRLGVEVRVVERVPGGNPLANKLRMLELAASDTFDVLVALDCDTVVLGDPSPYADADHICAKAADFDRFTDEEWHGLFRTLGVPEPPRTLTTTAMGTPVPPYFNSGVVYVPHALCGRLGPAWTDAYARLREAVAADPSLIREQWRWLVEQLSLGFGILLEGLPWRELPPEVNYPTHVPVPDRFVPSRPVIAHYHGDHDDDGFLLRCRTPRFDSYLDAFNRRRAEVTGQPYAGIARRPLPERLRRAGTEWFWAQLADRAWYRSPQVTAVRQRVKRALASRG